jgi:hypothetical protein
MPSLGASYPATAGLKHLTLGKEGEGEGEGEGREGEGEGKRETYFVHTGKQEVPNLQ